MNLNKIIENKIATITLNRPETSNALDQELIESLVNALNECDQDSNVNVIILTGAGKNFCSGGDVKNMKSQSAMFAGDSNQLRLKYKHGIQKIPQTIEALSTPIIAAVNGAAIGAGLDLACMCDIRICNETAKFGETFNKLSLVPGDGGTYFLQRIVGYAKAMELTLTARIFEAQEALNMGLVTKVSKDLNKDSLELANTIAKNAPTSIQMSRRSMIHAYRNDLNSTLEMLSAFQGIAQRSSDHFSALEKIK